MQCNGSKLGKSRDAPGGLKTQVPPYKVTTLNFGPKQCLEGKASSEGVHRLQPTLTARQCQDRQLCVTMSCSRAAATFGVIKSRSCHGTLLTMCRPQNPYYPLHRVYTCHTAFWEGVGHCPASISSSHQSCFAMLAMMKTTREHCCTSNLSKRVFRTTAKNSSAHFMAATEHG